MTTSDEQPGEAGPTPSAPMVQLDDRALADLQVLHDGVRLPWRLLGGSLRDRGEGSQTTDAVQVLVDTDVADRSVAAGAVLLADRELTPIGRLAEVTRLGPDRLSGVLRAERPREGRPFEDDALRPADLAPRTGPRHLVLVGRPLLAGDVARLGALSPELLLLVPTEAPGPARLAPAVLMAAVRHAAGSLGDAKVIATSAFLRDPESDEALLGALVSAYSAHTGELLADVSSPDVAAEVERWRPDPSRRGAMVLFTGLSGSGKSTLARDIAAYVTEHTARTVSLLDGDDVRRLLSSGLAFDAAGRETNLRRIAYVAGEVAKHGGLAICAPIAPYAETRATMRRMVEAHGDVVLVHVSTPLEECERRDRKGLYARARAGEISDFTGISDRYDVPLDADLEVDTSLVSRVDGLTAVLELLQAQGRFDDAARQGDGGY